jgi:predicted transglutaminase-like cysteine proteinase
MAMLPRMQRLFPLLLLLVSLNPISGNTAETPLFGYQETIKTNLDLFPQWLQVLERHKKKLLEDSRCPVKPHDECLIEDWLTFIKSIKSLPEIEQIHKVNEYANSRPYVLDKDNYDMDDYWATPNEFLKHNGDCEDYAITKMLSLKELGIDVNRMRVVVVQDTNLRIPHAVMSIDRDGETLILDNQIKEVISDKYIYHYVPVYSINERSWWMHLPKY